MPAIMKPTRLSCAVQTEPVAGGAVTTVSAYVLFDFADPYRFLTEQALWPMVVEQMPKGAIFDKGKLKPKAELIIAGAALAPTDRPVTGMRVTARLGTIEKRLAVFGDRFWRLTDRGFEMLEAKPFDSMPIDDAHAFGGPNHKANPRGRGFGARAIAEAGYDAPLPNVEDAQHMIRLIDDVPVPAHFGPLPPDHAKRLSYAGTYDQHWIKKVSPLKPEDFNPLFYCDAPEDQRLDSYLEGDEGFMVSGMSRGEAAVGGRLPKLRARAFVHRPADGSFTETQMVCDTVTLFPNITKATLAFRGIAKGEDRFGDDLGTVLLALERADDQPRPQDYYLNVFRLRSDPAEAHKHALSDFQLMPEVDPDAIGERRRRRLEKSRQDRIRFMENQHWGAQKAAADWGIPPEMIPPPDPSSIDDLPLVAMPTAEEFESGDFDLAELLDDVEALNKVMTERADKELAKAELMRRQVASSLPAGMLPTTALKPVADEKHMERFADLELDDEIQTALADIEKAFPSRDDVLHRLDGAGDKFVAARDQIDRVFRLIEGEERVDPEAAEKQFRLACARALKLPEGSLLHDVRTALDELPEDAPALTIDPEQGSGSKQEFADLFASLKNRKPEAKAPSGPDRAGLFREGPIKVDHAPAQDALRKAGDKIRERMPAMIEEGYEDDPIGGLLAKVGKIKPAVDPADADLTVGERLDKSKRTALERLDEAELDMQSSLAVARQKTAMAIFPFEPFMPGVAERFGSFVKEKLAKGQDFKGADLAGADLRGTDFSGLDLAGTFFEKANLSGARFTAANLEGAAFTEAMLDSADFTGARLEGANFSKASLRGARLDGCGLADSTMIETDFSGASARNIRLSKTMLINCRMSEADFGGAQIADLQLLQSEADGLILDGAKIERAAIMTISMKAASFAGAKLDRTVFTDLTAPGADFSGAELQASGFLGKCDLSGGRFEGLVAEQSGWNTTLLVDSCFLRARCHNCLFNGCDMTASDLRLASLKNTRFLKSTLVDSDLFGANLFSASLTQSDLRRSSLRGANLYFADLMETKLASCDLTGANLGKTRLEQPSHA